MVFKTKKIQIETLGEYLVKVRQDMNLSLEEASSSVGIKPKFLEALEDGNFKLLPPDVYVFGFLKQLGHFYSVDSQSLIEQYRKERGIAEQMSKQSVSSVKKVGRHFFGKVVVTPKMLTLGLAALFVVVTLAYVTWQVFSINKTPALEIFEPKDRQVIRQSSVEVSGKTDAGMTVTINDQSVFVGQDGSFKATLGLTSGPKELVFVAKNKFDKTVSRKISILGEPEVSAQEQKKSPEVVLELSFTDMVKLSAVLDDATTTEETFNPGQNKILKAMRKIVISTSSAGATRAKFNGQDLGVLGRAHEKLENIPFSLESGSINSN